MSKNENAPLPESDMSHKHKTRRFRSINLVGALSIVIALACVIVGIAYALYYNDTNRKYDIVRGGEKNDNQALNVEDEEANTTSPVDAPAAKRKIEYLEREINGINSISKFEAEDLSDQSIQLAPADQPSL